MSKAPRILSNAATAFDFSQEFTQVLSASDKIEGKELRLASAIYNAPATFDIANIFGPSDDKKRSKRFETALSTNCAAFGTMFNAAHIEGKTLKALKGLKRLETEAQRDAAARTVRAALALFERALSIAYMLHSCNAVISKVTAGTIAFNPGRNVNVEGKVTLTVGEAQTWTRKDAHSAGRALLQHRGILNAKPRGKSGNGNGVSTGAQKTVIDAATTLASTVAALPADAKADVSTSEGFEKMLATAIRARFVSDGSLDISDIAEFLRKSDTMQGVSINMPAPRAPAKPKAKAA